MIFLSHKIHVQLCVRCVYLFCILLKVDVLPRIENNFALVMFAGEFYTFNSIKATSKVYFILNLQNKKHDKNKSRKKNMNKKRGIASDLAFQLIILSSRSNLTLSIRHCCWFRYAKVLRFFCFCSFNFFQISVLQSILSKRTPHILPIFLIIIYLYIFILFNIFAKWIYIKRVRFYLKFSNENNSNMCAQINLNYLFLKLLLLLLFIFIFFLLYISVLLLLPFFHHSRSF